MANSPFVIATELEPAMWRLYRDFFDQAEKKRRWSLRDDIPWDQCNPQLDPAIGDVVESFCGVELYLPDYTSKILPVVRSSKGRTWFCANWGYEESKHSLVLCDGSGGGHLAQLPQPASQNDGARRRPRPGETAHLDRRRRARSPLLLPRV